MNAARGVIVHGYRVEARSGLALPRHEGLREGSGVSAGWQSMQSVRCFGDAPQARARDGVRYLLTGWSTITSGQLFLSGAPRDVRLAARRGRRLRARHLMAALDAKHSIRMSWAARLRRRLWISTSPRTPPSCCA